MVWSHCDSLEKGPVCDSNLVWVICLENTDPISGAISGVEEGGWGGGRSPLGVT